MELSQFIDNLDLNSYEKELILYLSKVDSANANTIYKNSKIPKGRIYSVLNELSHKGIITIIPTSPKRYKIEDIKKALTQYLEIKKSEVGKKIKEIDNIKIKEITYNLDKNTPSVYSFTGRAEHLSALISLRTRAEKKLEQIAPIFTGDFPSNRSLYEALKRGVKVRIIVREITKQNSKNIKECIKLGAQIRHLNTEDLIPFLIRDDTEMILAMEDYTNREERLNLITQNKSLIFAISQYFDKLWERSHKISKKDLK